MDASYAKAVSSLARGAFRGGGCGTAPSSRPGITGTRNAGGARALRAR